MEFSGQLRVGWWVLTQEVLVYVLSDHTFVQRISNAQVNGSDPRWGGSCRHARCAEDDAYIEDGALVLRSQRRPSCFSGGSAPGCFNYSTGAVTTQNKMTVSAHPGFRLCVSAKLPGGGGGKRGQGIWPAHWMMPNDESCDPDEGEIDILEMIDGDGYAHSTYHWQTSWPAKNCRYVGERTWLSMLAMIYNDTARARVLNGLSSS